MIFDIFGFIRKISRQSILLVIALMVLIIPLISFVLEWNMKIEFPRERRLAREFFFNKNSIEVKNYFLKVKI